jgi:hypothetical protein
MNLFGKKSMEKFDEVKVNYRKTESGEVYILLEDIIDILEKRILPSNIIYTILAEFIDQLKQTKP